MTQPPTEFQIREANKQLLNLLDNSTTPNSQKVAQLIATHPDTLTCRNRSWRTPLHLAAYWGHDEALHQLIAAGADLHATDSTGTTPLHYACFNRSTSILSLLRAGADPNKLAQTERTSCLQYLCNIAPNSQHHLSARPDLIALLLDYGANPNLAPTLTMLQSGNTLAHAEATNLLLDAGAELPVFILANPAFSAQPLTVEAISRYRETNRADIPADLLMYERHLQALAFAETLPSIAIPTLTAPQICLLANLGRHHEVFTPEQWQGHGEALQSLLNQLPTWLYDDVLAHHPLLYPILDFQSPTTAVSEPQLLSPPREGHQR